MLWMGYLTRPGMKPRHTFFFLILGVCLANGVVAFVALRTDAIVDGVLFEGWEESPWTTPDVQAAAVIIVISVCLALFLYWVSARLYLDPLRHLARAAKRMGSGEPVALPRYGSGDLGQIAKTLVAMSDNIVETHKHVEARIRETAERVEHVEKEKAFADCLAATGRVATGLASELLRPLANLRFALGKLRSEGVAAADARGALDQCDENEKRMQAVVRRAVDYSRKRPDRAPLLVTTPLKQALELMRPRIDAAGVKVKLQVEENKASPEHLRVLADASDLQHVFYNLIANSVEAMPRGGLLNINVSQAMRWVVVEIIDTGVGLTVEEVSASFEYFHSNKPFGKGEGLGLSVAQHVVQGYRGALTLNSVKGEGTKAAVELPGIATVSRPSVSRRGAADASA